MSIKIIKGTEFGFDISKCSSAEFSKFMKEYQKCNDIRCIICNSNTSSRFKLGLFGCNIITVNNKVPDNIIYFNNIR